MQLDQIKETIHDLNEAKGNFERIKRDYAGNQVLLDLYSTSAQTLVNNLEQHLQYLLNEATGSNFAIENKSSIDVDVWIRLEGKYFDGKGPIGIIGSYLKKLNSANRHAVSLIAHTRDNLMEIKDKILDFASFDLVATEHGSLKLGLKSPDINERLIDVEDQIKLDLEDIDKDDFNENSVIDKAELDELALEGFRLLARTVASANDDELLDELIRDYSGKDVIKLFHFARELAPSSRSPIEYISFEGEGLKLPTNSIRTDKQTRKILSEKAKVLKIDTEYVEGRGWLRAVDLDHYAGVIRPFHYKNKNLDQIDCRFSEEIYTSSEIGRLLEQFVSLSGFLVFNQRNIPIRLDIDEIIAEEEPELE